MKTEHTPEPWKKVKGVHVVSGEKQIARCWVENRPVSVAHANARRIVACVNACAGIETDHIEKYGLPDFAQKISDLREQRNELLAAAEAIEIDAEECLDFDECTAMLVPIDTYHKLMEAIASVKEKQNG